MKDIAVISIDIQNLSSGHKNKVTPIEVKDDGKKNTSCTLWNWWQNRLLVQQFVCFSGFRTFHMSAFFSVSFCWL